MKVVTFLFVSFFVSKIHFFVVMSDIILTSTISKVMAEADLFSEKRLFKLAKDGLVESQSKDRRLKKTLWRRNNLFKIISL